MLADSWRCSSEIVTHHEPRGLFNSSCLDYTHQHDMMSRGKAPLRNT